MGLTNAVKLAEEVLTNAVKLAVEVLMLSCVKTTWLISHKDFSFSSFDFVPRLFLDFEAVF